jgi:hypothetical protein
MCHRKWVLRAMSKLLIYIGENEKFDFESAVATILALEGVTHPRAGKFIGAIFECKYTKNGQSTIVRISPELETITVEGLYDSSLEFAIEFQKHSPMQLRAIDMDYSFNVSLQNLSTISEFRRQIGS